MAFNLTIFGAFLFVLNSGVYSSEGYDEPTCSKFHFEEKVLEKMVRVEHQLALQKERMDVWEQTMKDQLKSMQFTEDSLKAARESTGTKMLEYDNEMKTLVNDTQNEIRLTIASIMDETSENLKKIKGLEGQERPAIAFKVRNLEKASLKSGSIIRYLTEVLNVGGAYDSGTGKFTAPVDGTYLFTVQICTRPRNFFNVFIMANDKQVGTASYQENDATGSCTSGDAVAVLKKGETAWIKNYSGAASTVYEDSSDWNSFSGVLISA